MDERKQVNMEVEQIKKFIEDKFPLCKKDMDADVLNNVSGNELVELIREYESRGDVVGVFEQLGSYFDPIKSINELQKIRKNK